MSRLLFSKDLQERFGDSKDSIHYLTISGTKLWDRIKHAEDHIVSVDDVESLLGHGLSI